MPATIERIVGVSTVEERLFGFDYQKTVIRPILQTSCIDEIDNNATGHRPTIHGVCDFLGPDTDFNEPECPLVNRRGLHHLTPVNWSIGTRFVTNRREVEIDFYQNFEPLIHAAFSQSPLMYSRSDAPPGPMRRERPDMNCGYQLTWPRTSDSLHERSAMIGLFKDPGTIQNKVDKALLEEIREYAYAYECPQVFVFDSVHLLIVQLKAYNREELKSLKCSYEYCRIPRKCVIPDQSTIQYGLYALAWRGWMRLSSTMVNGPDGEGRPLNVVVDGCTRRTQYWSGRPMWERLGKITIQHPNGWFRLLCSPGYNVGCWAWVSRDLEWYFYDTGNIFQ